MFLNCLRVCYLFVNREHSNFVNCVRFAPDGSKFITVSSDKKGIIYDGKTCEKLGELSSDDGHRGSIYAVSWSPDGKQVLTYVCLFFVVLFSQSVSDSLILDSSYTIPLGLNMVF